MSVWKATSASPTESASTPTAPLPARVPLATGLDLAEHLVWTWTSAARRIFARAAFVPTPTAPSSASVLLDTALALTLPPAWTLTSVVNGDLPCAGLSAVKILLAPTAVCGTVIRVTTLALRAPVMTWTSAENTALRFAVPSAARTPRAPTAACQPATLAISLHQGAGARMWTSAGTGLSAAPMQCARICPAPSSASVTKATRGHGTGVTAWM